MSKNTPITARVSKGLFGKKVSEPILNVGAAGVSGNSRTGSSPSPAKMKSSPFKETKEDKKNPLAKGSEAKESNSGMISGSKYQSVNKSTGAGQQLTTPGSKVTSNVDALNKGKKNLGPDYKPSKAETDKANKELAGAKAKDAVASKESVTTTVPGTSLFGKAEGDLYKREEGDAQTALDRRGNVRNIKNLTGQEKRNDMRSLRANADKSTPEGKKAFKDGKAKIKESKRSQRRELIKSELQASKNQSAQNLKASESGGYSSKDVKSTERSTTASDFKVSDKPVTQAGLFSGEQYSVPGSIEKENPAIAKKTNGLFNKKSPMKMKYFK